MTNEIVIVPEFNDSKMMKLIHSLQKSNQKSVPNKYFDFMFEIESYN